MRCMLNVTRRYNDCEDLFVFEQKTTYEIRIRDWSSDVCSSDLTCPRRIPCYRRARLASPGGRGGTGRRAGFRFQYRKMWGFESLRPHQIATVAAVRALI